MGKSEITDITMNCQQMRIVTNPLIKMCEQIQMTSLQVQSI